MKNNNILDVKSRNYYDCGYCKDEKEIIRVPFSTYSLWLYLLHKMGRKEWIGLFDVVNETICNFRIPKQTVKTTECELKEDEKADGILHSHHDMGEFHSAIDDKFCRNLYDYSLVIGWNGITGSCRRKLPCGGWGHIKLEIEVVDAPSIDYPLFEEDKASKGKFFEEKESMEESFERETKRDPIKSLHCTDEVSCLWEGCRKFDVCSKPWVRSWAGELGYV